MDAEVERQRLGAGARSAPIGEPVRSEALTRKGQTRAAPERDRGDATRREVGSAPSHLLYLRPLVAVMPPPRDFTNAVADAASSTCRAPLMMSRAETLAPYARASASLSGRNTP